MAKTVVAALGGLLVGLVLGAALGLTLSDPPEAPPTAGSSVGRAGASATPDAAPTRARTPASSETASSQTAPDTTARRHVATGSASAEAFLDGVDIGALPRGDGTISGHVRRADGAGVEGALISATPATPPEWDTEPGDDSPAAELAATARHLRWTRDARVTATTGPDGAFEVTGLAAREHSIGARHDGFALRIVDSRTRRVQPGTVVDFVATPLTKVSFVIRGPEGAPTDKAQIKIEGNNRTWNRHWNTGSKSVDVEPGTFTVSATAGDFQEWRAAPTQATFAEGAVDQTVAFDLERVPGIGGSVTREGPDDRRQGMQVWLLRTTDGSTPSAGRLVQAGKSEHVWSHNDDTRYAFRDLPPGTYALGAARMNMSPTDITLVELGDAFVRRDLVVADFDRDACVEIAAFGPDGTPVTDLGGVLNWRHEGGSSGRGVNPIVRPGGAIWVPIPPEHDAGVGTHSIDITSKAYGRVSREFTPGPGARVEIHFQHPATGTVAIAGYQGSGAEGRVAVSLGPLENSWSNPQITLDADGRAQIPATAPGSQRVTIQTSDQFGRGLVLASREVTLVSGENDITLALPGLHTLTVELSGTVGTRRVGLMLEGGGGGGMNAMAPDDSGRVLFDLLPEGTYKVHVFNGEGGSKTVSIPGTTLVRF